MEEIEDGSCFLIQSFNLCLSIGEFGLNILIMCVILYPDICYKCLTAVKVFWWNLYKMIMWFLSMSIYVVDYIY